MRIGAYSDSLCLTAASSAGPSGWLLPRWFHLAGRDSALSYHGDRKRWRTTSKGTLLDSAKRGQEFVLDCDDYPESYEWLAGLIAANAGR